MLEVIKGTGLYPKHRNVVCTCWDQEGGYWYLIEDTPRLSLWPPAVRGKHIVSRLSDKIAPVLCTGTQPGNADTEKARICSLVDADGLDLHWISARFEDFSPGAEAICRRLAEILDGGEI